jgi:hypothetical protein
MSRLERPAADRVLAVAYCIGLLHKEVPRRYLAPMECMSKRNFQFRPLYPIFGLLGRPGTRGGPDKD